jgi:hypothetical protein
VSRDPDALHRLRRANPVPAEEAPAADSPQARATFERIVATAPESPVRQRRVWWRRTWILLPGVALVAAAGYGLFREVTQPLVTVCYSAPNLLASRAEVQGGDRPVAACEALWRPGGRFNTQGHPVPALEACVLASGGVGVFPQAPGTDVCSALSLAHITTGPRHGTQDQALLRGISSGCAPPSGLAWQVCSLPSCLSCSRQSSRSGISQR